MVTSTEAAAYPLDVEAHVTLSAGRQIHFHALHAGDEQPIRTLFAGLGARTRYQRFLSPMPALPDSVVRALADVDYQRSLAIVAEDEAGADGVVALASYGSVEPGTAEVAVVVRDDWQERGVGTAIVDLLLAAAVRRGFARFAASMTAENVGIRKILDRAGRVIASKTVSGVSELVFEPRVSAAHTSRPAPSASACQR
jgi:RimJ/RimL family protein N-acetyltransferase